MVKASAFRFTYYPYKHEDPQVPIFRILRIFFVHVLFFFCFKDGTYPAGEKTSDQNGEKLGWIQKDGKWWAFGSDGYLKRGWAQDNASGKWYLIEIVPMLV